jgi:hypothetical protein
MGELFELLLLEFALRGQCGLGSSFIGTEEGTDKRCGGERGERGDLGERGDVLIGFVIVLVICRGSFITFERMSK